MENRLYACPVDSTLLTVTVVHKPADRCVAASLNRDMAKIRERSKHWSLTLNLSKTKPSIVSRCEPSPWLLGRTCPNLDILDVMFDNRLNFKDHEHSIVSRVSQRIGILRLGKRIFVDNTVFFHCSNTIMQLFSNL